MGPLSFKPIILFFNLFNKKRAFQFGWYCVTFLFSTAIFAEDTLSLFPLDHYDQNVTHYLKPTDPNSDKPLLSKEMQKKRMDIFYDHYFGRYSPWNENFVYQLLYQSPDELKNTEKNLIDYFSNDGKSENEIGYGENFRPHTQEWITRIRQQINLSQFDEHRYQLQNRAIAIDNLAVRALPTEDVHFYSYKLAGQGYPFDNLQMSALWAGTPLYIVGESQDHAWLLVLTPDYMGWVQRKGVAHVSNNFINAWTIGAHEKLAAITQTKTSIIDENEHFLFSSYVGAVFPVISAGNDDGLTLMVPGVDANGFALVKHARVSSNQASVMPMLLTARHVATIMQTLIGRPYGWGGAYFYNDCSAELKSLFTPFGIWLPRHSADQLSAGKMVDMSWGEDTRRLSYLMQNGQPMLTIVYVGGHVMLYMGNYSQAEHGKETQVAMTYQNVWGLRPHPSIRRAVIGQSVIFPMLLQYPEDTTLGSLANEKYFKVMYLNELPTTHSLLKDIADIHNFMYPEILLSYGENFLKRSFSIK